MGHFNTNASKANTDRQVIRHIAGNEAIAVNDLLCVAERGKIWPVKSKSFGTVPKAGTDIQLSTVQSYGYHRDYGLSPVVKSYFDSSTLCNYILSINTKISGGSNRGIYLDKYNDKGENVKHFTLKADSTTNKGSYSLLALSNGNLLVLYSETTSCYFCILNKNLDVVVPETALGTITFLDVVALSNGSFAIFAGGSNDTVITFATYTNAGVAIVTPITLTTYRTRLKAKELSSGNIAICADNYVGIVNVSGTFVSPLALSSGLITDATVRLDMSVINGFFCCVLETDTRICAAVYNNAGQLKNYSNTFQYRVTNRPGLQNSLLVNDGAAFWVLVGIVDSSFIPYRGVSFNVLYLPTTGLNVDNKFHSFNYDATFNIPSYSSSNTSQIQDGLYLGMVSGFYSRGMVVFTWANTVLLLEVKNGNIQGMNSIEHDASGLTSPVLPIKYKIIDVGDGAYFWVGAINGGIKKYIDTTIIGVAKTTIQANSENTPVDFVTGSGVFTINPIPGEVATFSYAESYDQTSSKYNLFTGLFDQTVTTIQKPGKSGTIFNNSVLFNK